MSPKPERQGLRSQSPPERACHDQVHTLPHLLVRGRRKGHAREKKNLLEAPMGAGRAVDPKRAKAITEKRPAYSSSFQPGARRVSFFSARRIAELTGGFRGYLLAKAAAAVLVSVKSPSFLTV
jgi:hypothetical protein